MRRELGTAPGDPIPWGLAGVSDETRREAIASWPRIFEIDQDSGGAVQATVEHLYLTDVIDILPAPAPEDVPPDYRVNVSTYLRGSRDVC